MKKNKLRKYLYRLGFFATLLFIVSCGRLNDRNARDIFLEKNPSYTIIHSETGEGWEGVAYHHFTYKKPDDRKIYKEMWCFVQEDDGTWRVYGTPVSQD